MTTLAPLVLPPDTSEIPPFLRYRRDPYQLIRDGHIWTKREDSATDVVRQTMPDKPHIWHMVRMWQREHPWLRKQREADMSLEDRVLVFKKTRRMMATWTISAMNMWYAASNPDRAIGVGSKIEDDSDWIIKNRYAYVMDNLPDSCFDGRKPTYTIKKCEMILSNGSVIRGHQQTPEAWRQYTYTRAHLEEVAMWPDFQATYAGLHAACRWIDIVSTPMDGTAFQTMFCNNPEALA